MLVIFHKRSKFNSTIDDIILVGLRDFQDEKCDVIWKYYPEEAKTLKALGEIPDSCVIDESKKEENEGAVIFFIGIWRLIEKDCSQV